VKKANLHPKWLDVPFEFNFVSIRVEFKSNGHEVFFRLFKIVEKCRECVKGRKERDRERYFTLGVVHLLRSFAISIVKLFDQS